MSHELIISHTEDTLLLSSKDNITVSPSQLHLMSLRSKNSRKTVKSILNRIVGIFGCNNHEDFDWMSLKPVDIDIVIETLVTVREFKPRTVNSYLSAIRGVFNAAYRNSMVDLDVYQKIKTIKNLSASTIARGRKPIKKSVIAELVNYCESLDTKAGFRDAVMIALLAGCGLRRDELVSLRLSDYSPDKRQFLVTGKGNKQREVDIPTRAATRLNDWIRNQRGNEDGYIFCRIDQWGHMYVSTDKSMSGNAVYDMLKKRTHELQHEHIRPHGLRRFCGTNMLKSGTDLVVVRDVLGHSSINTTQIYIINDADEKRKAVEANDI